jgi:hypothetical protein
VPVDAVSVNPGATVEVLHQTVDGALLGAGASGDTWTTGPDQRLVVVVDDGQGEVRRYGVFLLPDDVPELTVETPGEPTRPQGQALGAGVSHRVRMTCLIPPP